MVSQFSSCPHCGYPAVAGGNFCQACGRPLTASAPAGAVPPAAAAPLPSGGAPPPMYPPPPLYAPEPPAAAYIPGDVVRDRERTVTGLLLLVIGFALSWIPFITFIGSILAFIGIIFVILGRGGYGDEHRRNVVIGGLLFFLVLIATVVLAVWFIAALLSAITVTPGSTTFTVSNSAIQNDFLVFFVGAAVLGILGSLSRVILVYSLSDRTTRMMLWAAFAISVVFSVLVLVILYPQITTAISQATSGSTPNSGPLTSLQTQATELGLINVLPTLLFAWAYWRAREEAIGRTDSPAL